MLDQIYQDVFKNVTLVQFSKSLCYFLYLLKLKPGVTYELSWESMLT